MATLSTLLFLKLTGRTNGRDQKFGDKAVFKSFTPTLGVHHEVSQVIPDDYQEETLWATGDQLVSFEYGVLETDKDVTIKLSDGAVDAIFTVLAGSYALFGGSTITDLGGDGSADTMGLIDTVVVKRNAADGVGDAFVTLTLFA